MSELVDWFRDASWVTITAIGIVLNLSVTATSIAVWSLLDGSRPTRGQLPARAITSATATTVVNGLVLVPAWWLWQRGTLHLPSPELLPSLAQFVYLTLFMDAALYWIHRIGHHELVYRFVHERHHDEVTMTPLSLFVMHPIEAAGFGLLMLTALLLVPVSVPAIAAFGTLNVAAGTLAHRPVGETGSADSRLSSLGGWAAFHQAHHADPDVNLGFFIPFWDRVAGTAAAR